MIDRIKALTERELAAIFLSFIAYVVGVLFLLVTGMLFTFETLTEGGEATMRPLFDHMSWLLILALPLITMRMISDEYASGTVETLMTAPVSDAEVVLGKFFGTFLFYVALILSTLVYVVALAMFSKPDLLATAYGYLGLLLLGALYASVGLFASSLTRHQLIAAVLAIAILALFSYAVDYLAMIQGGAWRNTLSYINILHHFKDFSKGIFDTKAIVFFLSSTAFFLFLCVKVMESKRWR